MAPPAMNSFPKPRQLAPTVGQRASGVTFRAGLLGGFGDTIDVGTAIIDVDGGFGRIVDNGAYMPARNHLVSACVVPVGSANIFIGMTAEALGFRGGSRFFPPALHPIDEDFYAGIGARQPCTYMAADRDLTSAYQRSGPAAVSSQEVPASRSHFIGMVQAELVPSTENSEPDSILPAIDGKVDSEVGSESNNSESDDDGTAFARDVMITTGRLHGVYMAAPAATNAEEEVNPEEGEHTPSKEGKSLNDTYAVIEDGKKDAEFPPVDELPAEGVWLSPSRKADPPAKKADLKKRKPDLRAQKADLPPKKAELPPKKLEVGGGSGVNKNYEGKKKPAAAFEDPNEIDEYDLLRTPIDANEPPEFLEARRQALLRQTAALETKRKELKGAQNAIAEAQDAVEEYERRVRRSAHKKLPGLSIPDDHPVRRRLEKVDWAKEVTRTNYKGEPVYGTPAVNATAAYAILNDDRYMPDEKLKYSNVLLGLSLIHISEP